MTTIAWDGKTLAGDTFADRGGLKYHVEAKVFDIPEVGVLFGGAGNLRDVLAVRDWLAKKIEKPTVSDFAGIIVRAGSVGLMEDSLAELPLPFPKFAVGSGRDFAIAAMRLGSTAREAVELACEFDTFSAAPIVTVELKAA